MKLLVKTVVFLIIIIGITGCNENKDVGQITRESKLNLIDKDKLNKLSQKTIYFGHQSVGKNIIDGINDLIKENEDIKINLSETSNPDNIKVGDFAHSPIGKNRNPNSKINQFEEFMDNGIAEKVDIAFLKLCYIDFNTKTDVNNTFKHYKNVFENIKSKYPKTVFIHLTAPLTVEEKGIKRYFKKAKNFIKEIIGKDVYDDNSVRFKYNELIRKEYLSSNTLFDIAKIESTYPNGKRLMDDKNIESLIPEYSDDGRHLYLDGRKIVAEELLLFLMNIENI